MKEHPIIFSGDSVWAILEGRKTQTRRVMRLPKSAFDPGETQTWINSFHQDGIGNWVGWSGPNGPEMDEFCKKAYPNGGGFPCPYGAPGDRLWVRETWGLASPEMMTSQEWYDLHNGERDQRDCPGSNEEDGFAISIYRADGKFEFPKNYAGWRSPIRMPRWVSRITLELTGVRVERVQEITPADAVAEGYPTFTEYGDPVVGGIPTLLKSTGPIERYKAAWDSLNARRGYPWESNPWVWVLEFKRVTSEGGDNA